jgi:hypothetical protein
MAELPMMAAEPLPTIRITTPTGCWEAWASVSKCLRPSACEMPPLPRRLKVDGGSRLPDVIISLALSYNCVKPDKEAAPEARKPKGRRHIFSTKH